MFHIQKVEKHWTNASLPERCHSTLGDTNQLVGSVFKKLVANLRESLLDPFESVYPMPPGSVIASGLESNDQRAHTDTCSAPHAPPPPPTGQS